MQYIYGPPPPPPPANDQGSGNGLNNAKNLPAPSRPATDTYTYTQSVPPPHHERRQRPYEPTGPLRSSTYDARQGHHRPAHQHTSAYHPYGRANQSHGVNSGQPGQPRPDGDLNMVSPEIRQAARDIEKWIQERKKKWPSSKRLAEKEREQQQQPQDKDKQLQQEQQESHPQQQSQLKGPAREKKRGVCKYFIKGNCKSGASCQFSHPVSYKRFEAPKDISLFRRLVESELDEQHEPILDFITYLNTKGLLD